MKIFHLLLAVVLWSSASDCAKILAFFCAPGKSHHLVFQPIIRGLAARGHAVDYYTHYPMPDPPRTLKQIVLSLDAFGSLMNAAGSCPTGRELFPQFQFARFVRNLRFTPFFDSCYTPSLMQELLHENKTYDLVLSEFSMMQEEVAVFLHRFKALGVSVISVLDSYWLYELSGFPTNPSYMVSMMSGATDKMSFFERLQNFVDIQLSKIVDYYNMVGPIQRFADQHLTYEGWESRPSVMNLASDMALVLEIGHPSIGYSYPKPPHHKEAMGTNVNENPPPLPEDLQKFMDSAEHGVVYFCLGTIVNVGMLKRSNAYEPLLKVLSNLKQKVLWKWTSWEDENPPEVPNIKFSKWLPQQSILAHNKTKLFITHGGLGGMTEAIYHAVPLIGHPALGDQLKNVKFFTKAGMGLEMQLDNVTEASMTWAINEVLYNPKYKQEALRRSDMFRDRPMKPVDEAVYWIEYVLRHGKVLQPAAAQMPFYQLYLLDVIGFLALSTLIAFVLTVCLLKVVGRKIVGLWKGKSDSTLKTQEQKKMKIS